MIGSLVSWGTRRPSQRSRLHGRFAVAISLILPALRTTPEIRPVGRGSSQRGSSIVAQVTCGALRVVAPRQRVLREATEEIGRPSTGTDAPRQGPPVFHSRGQSERSEGPPT